MKYKYFFFDFDGMLCDSYDHITSAFVKTLKQTRKININYQEAYDLFKITFEEVYKHYQVSEEESKIFESYYQDLNFAPKAKLYLPIKRLLENILASGGLNFIYTNRGETLYQYLEEFQIKDYFKDIIINANKPEPQVLLNMINKYQLDPSLCVVVGDRFLDVEGAYNAKIAGILYDEDARVFLHHATHVISKINQLYNFIDLPYKIRHNYHTHTTRCNHAIGTDEEYVIEAIKEGYQTLGFSDHLMIPNLNLNYEYFDSIALLKEKYKNQINIKIALEVEYYPYYVPFYNKIKQEHLVDYLIFGNHGTMSSEQKVTNGPDFVCFINDFTDVTYLDKYYEVLKKAVETKLFKYIAHPDCFLKGYGKWDENTIALTHKIAKLLQDNHLYAELSASGYRSRKKFYYQNDYYPPYPFKEFFKILKEYDIKFVLGCDAHAPSQLHDEAVAYIINLAKELDLKIVNFENEINDL